MLRARQILERTSFVFALTNDPRQLEIAKLAIDRLLAYKRWDYFLEGGEETIGLQRAPEATLAVSFARKRLRTGSRSNGAPLATLYKRCAPGSYSFHHPPLRFCQAAMLSIN